MSPFWKHKTRAITYDKTKNFHFFEAGPPCPLEQLEKFYEILKDYSILFVRLCHVFSDKILFIVLQIDGIPQTCDLVPDSALPTQDDDPQTSSDSSTPQEYSTNFIVRKLKSIESMICLLEDQPNVITAIGQTLETLEKEMRSHLNVEDGSVERLRNGRVGDECLSGI